MKTQLFLLSLMFLFVSCQTDDDCVDRIFADDDNIPSEEYDIINLILETDFPLPERGHLLQESKMYSEFVPLTKFIDNNSLVLDSQTVKLFFELNSQTYNWDNQFQINTPLLTSEEWDCRFRTSEGTHWKGYYEQYDDSFGVLSFSRPAIFNDEAVIEYDHYCGFLCGYGHLIKLKKLNGNWVIDKHIHTWIS